MRELEQQQPAAASAPVSYLTQNGNTPVTSDDDRNLVGQKVALPANAWQGQHGQRKYACMIVARVARAANEYVLRHEGNHYVFTYAQLQPHFTKALKRKLGA